MLSKVLEKVVYNRLLHYLNKQNVLFDNQYGFRKNHSTLQALTDLLEKIATAFDNKKFTIGILLDLSKVFDTVNHEILFLKLEHYGIRELAWTGVQALGDSYCHRRLERIRPRDVLHERQNNKYTAWVLLRKFIVFGNGY